MVQKLGAPDKYVIPGVLTKYVGRVGDKWLLAKLGRPSLVQP